MVLSAQYGFRQYLYDFPLFQEKMHQIQQTTDQSSSMTSSPYLNKHRNHWTITDRFQLLSFCKELDAFPFHGKSKIFMHSFHVWYDSMFMQFEKQKVVPILTRHYIFILLGLFTTCVFIGCCSTPPYFETHLRQNAANFICYFNVFPKPYSILLFVIKKINHAELRNIVCSSTIDRAVYQIVWSFFHTIDIRSLNRHSNAYCTYRGALQSVVWVGLM